MDETKEQLVTTEEADNFLASLTDEPIEGAPEPVVEATEAPVERASGVADAMKRIQLEAGASEGITSSLSDEDALAWGSKLDKRSKDHGDALLDRANLRKELEALKAQQPTPTEATTVGEQATPTPSPVDLSGTVDTVAEWMGADSEGKAALTAMAEAIRDSVRQEYAAFGDRIAATENLAASRLMDDARATLTGMFPVLDNSETFAEVEKVMGSLHNAGMFPELPTAQRFQALMRMAALSVTPDEAPPLESEAEKAAKRSGSPTRPTPSKSRKAPEAKMTQEAVIEAKARFITNNPGVTIADVNREFGDH
jgi:hypothetical protein